MSQSIITVSGLHRQGANITPAVRRAIAEAVIEGTENGFIKYQRKIPQDTGTFVAGTREAVGAVVGRSTFGKSKVVIPWSAIEAAIVENVVDIDTGEHYARFHIRGHPDQAFFGQYKHPSKPGSEPMNPREFMAIMRAEIKRLIPQKLRLRGLEVK